jgi:hypothetical protein
MMTALAYDRHVDQLFDRMRQLHALLSATGVPYRIVGGMAVFLQVSERDPLRARLTADVDAAIDRRYLPEVIAAARKIGWIFRHTAGVDMLIDADQPRVRSAVHLLFLNEKVRPEYADAVPSSEAEMTTEGILVAPVVDLVRMKLTSYRLKDRVHIQDLDGVGLISTEIESQLPALLLDRLAAIRASE